MGIDNPVHLLFIAVVALLVLGPKRLPQLARALGQGVREFKGAFEEASAPSPQRAPSPLQIGPPPRPGGAPTAAGIGQEPVAAVEPAEQGRPGEPS